MNKSTLLLLCSTIISLNAMHTRKFNVFGRTYFFRGSSVCLIDTVPLEIIIEKIFPLQKEYNGLEQIKIKQNDQLKFIQYKENIIKPLIMLARTNKSLYTRLSPHIVKLTYVSCNDIFKYFQKASSLKPFFLKQNIPIMIINDKIVTYPSGAHISDLHTLLDFSITLLKNEKANKPYLLLTFECDLADIPNKKECMKIINSSIVEDIEAYSKNQTLVPSSLIHLLLSKHTILFHNIKGKTLQNVKSENLNTIVYYIKGNCENDALIIPISSVNLETKKYLHSGINQVWNESYLNE